jgi:hypothetical protein
MSERADAVDEAARHIEAGRFEEGLLLFLRQVAGIAEHEIAMLQSAPPVWAQAMSTVPTLAREMRALQVRGTPVGPIGARTMFLSGSLTRFPVFPSRADEQALVPDAEHVDLPGQRHLAFATDPVGFAAAVHRFNDHQRSTFSASRS